MVSLSLNFIEMTPRLVRLLDARQTQEIAPPCHWKKPTTKCRRDQYIDGTTTACHFLSNGAITNPRKLVVSKESGDVLAFVAKTMTRPWNIPTLARQSSPSHP
jgi:hypothetical protein